MLRSYNSDAKKKFTFSCINDKSIKINRSDSKILNQIETEINTLTARVQGQSQAMVYGFIDTTNLHLSVNRRLSMIVKNILNQYDIGHFEKSIWCGLRKSTLITFEKIIPRIISKPSRNNSTPLEHLISNAISISENISPNARTDKSSPEYDTYRHDYLNPANKAQARRLRGIYNA